MTIPNQDPTRADAPHLRRYGRSISLFLSLLLLTLWVPSCSDSGGTEPAPEERTLTIVTGAQAQAPAGTVVPDGPTVKLAEGNGDPVVGATVTMEVLDGDGSVVDRTVLTDSRGYAEGIWILGREAGSTQRLRASAAGLSVEFSAQAVTPLLSTTYSGRDQYVDYHPGNLPLVLTAPHGGYLEPADIPTRTIGTTVQDRNTKELSLAIREAVFDLTGGYPHVIISNLHRRKLDPNREIVEAAQGNPDAERAWWEFQIFADEAGEIVEREFGEGLNLDIHGHGHDIPRVELGYLLSRTDLAQTDEILSGQSYISKSSVRAVASKAGASLAEIIRGETSLGALLEIRGFPCVPSKLQPNPGQDDYFTGGYNTVRHGSSSGGSISAIQLEHNFPGLRDEPANREAYAEALAEALVEYYEAHMDIPLAPIGGGS